VEAFSLTLALIAPEPRHTRRSAQFPRFCLLLPCDGKHAFETVFGFFGIRRDQPDFATMRLTPASDHPSVVVLISVIASSMQRVGSKPYLTFERLASWLRSEESTPSVEN
jgi:hypothetical protein